MLVPLGATSYANSLEESGPTFFGQRHERHRQRIDVSSVDQACVHLVGELGKRYQLVASFRLGSVTPCGGDMEARRASVIVPDGLHPVGVIECPRDLGGSLLVLLGHRRVVVRLVAPERFSDKVLARCRHRCLFLWEDPAVKISAIARPIVRNHQTVARTIRPIRYPMPRMNHMPK